MVKAVALAFCSILALFIRDIRAKFNDIDMKLGPVTKLDKRNKTTSKKIDVDFMSETCDVNIIFPIYGHFGAIRKPDSGRIVCKTYIFINSKLLSYKN